ncbi:MAG: alpha/beta hydrolase [Cycloclasticus sp. symbiont of Bathymodiolus heckerae]|nr:MAG: alpha/beta hydrolase [Cycloclasticus sp. symbiont of Bathymodiolus heckerae]
MARSTFVPAKWLGNAHMQTLWPFAFRKPPILYRTRERFNTPDGDFFDVDWYGSGEKGTVILIHGLTGSSSSRYILGLQQALDQQGYTTAALNFRACSGESNLKAGSYHAGFTDDIDQLYQAIRSKAPAMSLYSVGFSLGGNIMLNWLSEKADTLELSGSVAVSVPFKLSNCADKVDQGMSRIYRYHLISEMKEKLANKITFFNANNLLVEAKKLEDLGNINHIKSFWEFDNDVVARLHGFDDVHDYYKKSSCIAKLKNIKNKTLLIQALDDPFLTPSVIPKLTEISASTQLEVTEKGGHVGFISKAKNGQLNYWLETRIPFFIENETG